MRFQRFLDALDSAGGHILILGLGAALGAAVLAVSVSDGHTIIVGCGAALLALLRPKTS